VINHQKQRTTTLRMRSSSASSLSRKLLNPLAPRAHTQAGRSFGFEECFFSIKQGKSSGLSVGTGRKINTFEDFEPIIEPSNGRISLRTSGKFVGGGNRLSPRTNRA